MKNLLFSIFCIFLFGSAGAFAQQIGSLQDLIDFATDVNNGTITTGNYELRADIGDQNNPFTMIIGDDGHNFFRGNFNGNGHTIYVVIDGTANPNHNQEYVGLFSKIEGIIDSLVVAGSITGGDRSNYVGGVCGRLDSG